MNLIPSDFKPWLDILVTVSKLEDTFQMRRIENLFTNFLNTIRNNIKFIDETTECLKALQTMILQSEVSREWFYHNYRLWVDLLFYPNNANVREIVASMVQHLLPPQNVQLAPLMVRRREGRVLMISGPDDEHEHGWIQRGIDGESEGSAQDPVGIPAEGIRSMSRG